MKQLLIEIDDALGERLDRIAPARSRRRSEFIRLAIRRSLWELEERATAEAYRAKPDSAGEAYIDPVVWAQAVPMKRAAVTMKRTTVMVADDVHRRMKTRAQELGISMGDFVRWALGEALGDSGGWTGRGLPPFLRPLKRARARPGGGGDAASDVDHHLYGRPRRGSS